MSEELVTIATYNHPADCEIAKARLASEGIMSYAYNEKTIQVDPLLSPALGGVILKVGKDDVEKAMHIFEQPVEVDEEYREFFKETSEDILYKKEQQDLQTRNQNLLKWGCLGAIFVLALFFFISIFFSQ